MKCDIHAYNMLYNSVRFCIFKRPAVHCYCCFSLGYTKKHTYFHISFSNENGLGNLIANPWLFWPPEDALIFLLLHFGVPSNYIPTKGPVKQCSINLKKKIIRLHFVNWKAAIKKNKQIKYSKTYVDFVDNTYHSTHTELRNTKHFGFYNQLSNNGVTRGTS